MNEITTYLQIMIDDDCFKWIFSNPKQKEQYIKVVCTKQKDSFFIERFTQKQAFHETIDSDEFIYLCHTLIEDGFKQVNAFSESGEHALKISKKGKAFYKKMTSETKKIPVTSGHNRKKHYLIEEGTIVPPLIDMGIFTSEGKVVHAMYDKFRQINKFIEIIDDVIRKLDLEEYHIIDFGCGKSYLTFLVYYYFTKIRHLNVKMIGLDLKEDVIAKCNDSAKRYGYDDLHFEVGDIAGYRTQMDIDLVISLHACDTATDHALYNATLWNAKAILSVPCCQHELNAQLESEVLPIVSRYGIIKERSAALMTDMIRANLLQVCGYKTQVLEFVDLSHTPKNLLIRAVKSNLPLTHRKQMLAEVESLMQVFHVYPTFYALLEKQIKSLKQ